MTYKDCTCLSAAISIAALSAFPAMAQVSPLIIDRNRLDHPGFVGGGRSLEVLTDG